MYVGINTAGSGYVLFQWDDTLISFRLNESCITIRKALGFVSKGFDGTVGSLTERRCRGKLFTDESWNCIK